MVQILILLYTVALGCLGFLLVGGGGGTTLGTYALLVLGVYLNVVEFRFHVWGRKPLCYIIC